MSSQHMSSQQPSDSRHGVSACASQRDGLSVDLAEDDMARWEDEVASHSMSPWLRWALADDPENHDPAALMDRIEMAEGLLTQTALWQARDMQLLRDLRLREQREHEAGDSGEQPWVRASVDEDGWVASEIGFALGLSEAQVRRRLQWVDGLDRYPSVARLAFDGAVPAWTAQRLTEHLDELAAYMTVERLAEVADSTADWLRERPRTLALLARRMRRLLLRAKAEAGVVSDDSTARSHADRDVRISSRLDGCAELWALLPEPDAMAVAATLREATRQRADGDPRTAAQLRADVLVGSVVGAPAMYGTTGEVPTACMGGDTGRSRGMAARIDVRIPVESLAGWSEDPGVAPGYGLVPSVTVRDLLGTAQTSLRGVLVDADTGRLVGLAPDLGRVVWVDQVRPGRGYQHPVVLDELIRVRDQHCRAPGCTRAAARCDCDHIDPWPTGATSYENSWCLCRYHHRLKTHAPGWHLEGEGDDGLTWVAPTGRRYVTGPPSD